MTDNLFEQMTAISKAAAYDVLVPHISELKEQNAAFRQSLNDVLNTITKTDPKEVIDNPGVLIKKLSDICLITLAKHRPL